MTRTKELIKLRKQGMKIGGIACYMPTMRRWVLLRITNMRHPALPIGAGWVYPEHRQCYAHFATEMKTIRALRQKGRGKGKKPFPRKSEKRQMTFKSERQAYIHFLLRADEIKWA